MGAEINKVANLREVIVTEALEAINGERARSYGDATESFGRTADLWAAVLGVPVTAEQVALCLVQLKVARLVNSPRHHDSWVDIVGYAALGGEVAER